MLSVEDAFKKFRSRLELNDKEQKNVSTRHTEMRNVLRAAFDVENDFLTGSYKRYTKTKPLQDVDFLCVLGERNAFDVRNIRQNYLKPLPTRWPRNMAGKLSRT